MSAYSGLRIVDFSQGTAGPMASMFLGDFGAEIAKIEPIEGDRARHHPGYLAWNRNKQISNLDLSRAGDRETALGLIASADVALFDHAPGVLEAWGLDGAALTAKFPRLVHVWMPPYGVTGTWSQLPPRHSLLTALTGLAFRQGAYDDTPVHLVLPLVWYAQALMGANAIGAALLERSRSGLGQAVSVSGLHGMSQLAGPVSIKAQPIMPRGQPLGALPNYRLYVCSDGKWLFLGTLFHNFYKLALGVFGLEDRYDALVAEPELAVTTLEERFRSAPRDAWLEHLRSAGVPCAPVGDRADWLASPVIGEAGLRETFEHEIHGTVTIPGIPVHLLATPGRIGGLARQAPLPSWPAVAPTSPGDPRSAPLAGLKVLDLGTVIAGAHAGGVLANLGADVIKIEPAEGDPFRSDGGPFIGFSRGKRALGIDLKQASARETFFDLVRGADVVLDNYRLGVRDRLGIGYQALKAINPRIISCSINAYGTSGSRAERPGFDPLLQAEGGMMAAQGGQDDPILHTVAVNDVATAAVVAFGVISALNARESTGLGQEVQTSLMAQSLTYQIGEITHYAGRPANDLGGRDCVGVRALHRFYPCKDGWIALACTESSDVEALVGATGLKLPNPAAVLVEPRDGALADRLATWFKDRPRDATAKMLLQAGVPCAPVVQAYEAYEHAWLADNRMFEVWEHPRLGEIVSVRSYADFAASSGGFRYPTPDLGQHSVEILEALGYDQGRIAELLASGAIFEPSQSKAHLRDGGAALSTR